MNGVGDTDWRSGRTAADGRFELVDLAADRDHALLLKCDGFATVAYDLPARARNETPFDVGTLELQPAATVRGVLVDGDGAPLPDGIVELHGENADRGLLADGHAAKFTTHVNDRDARTDDLGRFTFADLAAGTYTVRLRLRGGPAQAGGSVTLAAGEVRRDLRLTLARTLGIEGRVIDDDGRGLAQVLVHDGAGGGAVVTREDGRFHLRGLGPGPHQLQALVIGSTSGDRGLLAVPPATVEAGSTGVELVMHRAATIRGVVLDAAGQPVPNARVWAEDGAAAYVTSARAAADGTFALAMAPGAIVDLLARPGREDETFFNHSRETIYARSGAPAPARLRAVQAPSDGVTLRLPEGGR